MNRQCQHDSGGECIICDKDVNSCCGNGKQCANCGSMFCCDCYWDKSVVVGKVQCKNAEYRFRCKPCRSGIGCDKEVDVMEFQCSRCTAEIVTDEDLVKYFLARYKITRDVAESRYRKWIKK